jgi:hypothetical protein
MVAKGFMSIPYWNRLTPPSRRRQSLGFADQASILVRGESINLDSPTKTAAVRRKRLEYGDHIIEQAASGLLLMLDLAPEIRGVPVACSSGA